MATNESPFGKIEVSAYRSRWRDGTLDLCAGCGVLFTGVAWQIELFWLPALAVAPLMALWVLLRRRVVEPRIGRVTFTQDRRNHEARAIKTTLWLGVGLLVCAAGIFGIRAATGTGASASAREWISALPVALLGIMALIVATVVGLTRFVGYAAALLGAGFVGVAWGLEPSSQILIGGTVITLSGCALFLRFLVRQRVPSAAGIEE